MKKIIQVLAAVAVISAGALAIAAEETPPAKVIAYYFHGSVRCYTCNMMEKYSRETIETYFKDQVQAGKLVFIPINVDEKNNAHFVNDYQLYTKALILSLVKDGKEIRHKNLDRIWQLAGNKQKFFDYVTSEINTLMKDAQ
ncbi:MAG: nitrophenyl compound nitroreductase subunit ArsF family protein [Candidatus Omnitrophota bacterium]